MKHLIFKTVKTLILDYFDFKFLVCKAIHLISKRPIAFKKSLRSLADADIPVAITPEMLIRGYETVSLNIIPQLQYSEDDEDEGSANAQVLSGPYTIQLVEQLDRVA